MEQRRREEEASLIPDDNPPGGWRQSRGWHPEPPRRDGTFKVALPLGDTEEKGLEGMDCHLWDPPLERFCLTEQVSLVGGLALWPLTGARVGCLC